MIDLKSYEIFFIWQQNERGAARLQSLARFEIMKVKIRKLKSARQKTVHTKGATCSTSNPPVKKKMNSRFSLQENSIQASCFILCVNFVKCFSVKINWHFIKSKFVKECFKSLKNKVVCEHLFVFDSQILILGFFPTQTYKIL